MAGWQDSFQPDTQASSQGWQSSFQPDDVSAPSSNDFLSRVGADWDKRKAMGETAADAYASGQQSLPETYAQIIGKTMFGGAQDLATQGVKSLAGGVSAVTPQSFKDRVSNFGNQMTSGNDYIAGKEALTQGAEAYQRMAKEYPRSARNIEAAGDILSMAPIGMAMDALAPAAEVGGNLLSRGGVAIADSADARAAAKRASEVQNIYMPKETPKTLEEQAARQKLTGITGGAYSYDPKPYEAEQIAHVAELPVTDSKPLRMNYNIIKKAVTEENNALKTKLMAADAANPSSAIIPKSEIINNIESQLSPLRGSAYLKNSPHIDTVLDDLKSTIPEGGVTASQLLEIRKRIDKNIKKYKGEGAFDPVRESAFTEAGRIVRNTTNDIVDKKYPNIGVKDSLEKQHSYLTAMENIATKIPAQSKTRLGIMAQKLSNTIPIKNALAKTVTGLGIAGGAAAFPATIPVALGAGALYGGYKGAKALVGPTMQKGLGVIMDSSGRLLQGQNPFARSGFSSMVEKAPHPQLLLPAPPSSPIGLPAPQRPYVNTGGSVRPMTDDELALHNMSSSEQAKRIQKVPQSIKPTEIEQIVAAQKAVAQYDTQSAALSKQGYSAKEIQNTLGKRPNAPSVPQDYGKGVTEIKVRRKNISDWDTNYNQFSKDGLTHHEIIKKIGKRPEAP